MQTLIALHGFNKKFIIIIFNYNISLVFTMIVQYEKPTVLNLNQGSL